MYRSAPAASPPPRTNTSGSSALVRLTRPTRDPPAELVDDGERIVVTFACRQLDVLAAHGLGIAVGQIENPAHPPTDRRLARRQTCQAGTRRVPLPASPPAADAWWPVWIDDHVAELAGEPVVATLERAAGDDTAPDAGAERHQDHVCRPRPAPRRHSAAWHTSCRCRPVRDRRSGPATRWRRRSRRHRRGSGRLEARRCGSPFPAPRSRASRSLRATRRARRTCRSSGRRCGTPAASDGDPH